MKLKLELENPEPLHTWQEFYIAKELSSKLFIEDCIKLNNVSDETKQLQKRIEMFEIKNKLR